MADDDSPRSDTVTQAAGVSKPPIGHVLRIKPANKKQSSHTTSVNQDILVYIPDLPLDLSEDDAKQMIQTRVEATQRMTVSDVKCYSRLGVAVIQLMNEEDQKHLVSNVEGIILDMKRGINISFVSEIDFDCYIVLDRNLSKIPSSNEVARRYAQAYKTQELGICESISVQFPNIFRIVLSTFDELVKTANAPDFKIENSFATVYPRAECSFFEGLPAKTNEDKLSLAIATQIHETELPPTSFYVQYNKQTANAVVLAAKSAKKWTMEGYLTIDGQNISKKAKLAYRVLVSPIPHGFDLNRILNHILFQHRVVSHKHINDNLIIELDDIDNYNNCLLIGALRIDDITMSIKQQSVVSDPDNSELDAMNWYETAMFEIKPDIMTIINNYQHPIFRYKWNADNWIQQMKKAEERDRHSKKYDLNRHLLRVTVMLNTIAVLRKKKYVVNDAEVILKSERMRTIGYDHKSKLSYGKKISETELKTPYTSTTVKVVNDDCLVLYEKLVSEGHRPLLLNMANATNPGGGYRKGDGAQEENLFRRSDYYQSLDAEIADKDRSERLYCTSKCEQKRPTGYAGLYPMEEFGAIHTSGITVFRQTEENGYAYMKSPLYNVCAIAMAAYRDPPLSNKNMLENKAAINTHRKIVNIFAIAHHHKHDCLVLSALGCGAFKNPPEHVALLFKSVIYQYAGYFKHVYFAIVDDHNTGNRINPDGNFRPFQQILDGLVVQPPKTLRANGISGPYRILDKSSDGQLTLSDACILYLPPCQHGSKCRDLENRQHNNTYSHPPVCSLQDATSSCDQMNDEVHMFTFIHKTKCKYGGECDSKDPTHLSEYDHPEYCKEESRCTDISPEHLSAYRHLPICRHGLDCLEYLNRKSDHCNSFRHCKSICLYDNCCVNFHDKEHIKNTIHSFRQPCPFSPYNCSMFVDYIQDGAGKKISGEVEKHCLTHSHVCPFGRQCKDKDDKHYEASIHIARKLCPDLDKCSKLTQEDHLESFSHPGIRDIRLFCKFPGFECRQRFDNQHLRKYRHGKNHNHFSVAPSSSLNSSVDFVRNQGHMIRTVNNYIDISKWRKAKISHEILDWIRALQPVHRCAKVIFESILIHGHVMSRHYMDLLKRPKYVAKAVQQHSRIRLIFRQHNIPEVKQNANELIKILVEAEFVKSGADGTTPLDPDHDYNVSRIERKLKPPLSEQDIKAIHTWAVKIAQASIELHANPMGIGYSLDQILGTDKHIFSILGPHLGHYYGDIIIVFKQEIMFHPDTNFSVQAATSFGPSLNAFKHRSWLTDPGSQEKRVEQFHNSKLHCSVPRYEYAAATELVALTGKDKQSMDVNLQEVIQRWMTVDSHEVFESHLPQLIPLDYIDNVYMPKNVFESLTHEAQQSARAVFKNSLVITDHHIDLSLIKPGATVPLDPTRAPYQAFVLDKICQKIEGRMNARHTSQGVVITVPASKFEDHILLPMTISQSYDLYRVNKTQAPNHPEFTYIYWQAMNGDMMITISNEKIDPKENQPNLRCLVCYVAEKPSTATEDYHESYSYLNDGRPFQHYTNIHAGHFKAKSNVFYRGCNTDDFFTFCLKINHRTGEATLSHAGPNGIYNHQKIIHQFNKSDLDLSRIDYIHVSSGTQDVPIRNLMINHEPILELHPSFDKDFKINTSELLGKRRASVDHIVHPSYHGGAHNNNNNVASQPRKQRSTSLQSAPSTEKPSFFKRIKNAIFGPSKKDHPPVSNQPKSNPPRGKPPRPIQSRAESPPSNHSRAESPPSNRSRAKRSSPSPPPMASSKLPVCRDSVYCLLQNSKEHTVKYSHPCRFNELCRNQADEPHLVHARHNVPKCSEDRDCPERTDPVHRAKYRHTNLPDYLFPCRHQDSCYDKSSEHRIKFSHGEELPSIKKNKTSTSTHSGGAPRARLIPCRYGGDCRSTKNPQHMAQYSHPT